MSTGRPHRGTPHPQQTVASGSANHRWLSSGFILLGGWLLGAVFVRLALDWSDSQPYEGAVTEARYIVIAVLALGIGVGATIAAVVIWRKGHRRRSRSEGRQDKPSAF
ncbi:hypothetical protein E4P34_00950 [Kocuria rhizophila]|uniref:DUF2530 domain-containing protein n=1 Tax=Kocuria rhizophila TaxID=72000 RepID=A0AAX2S9W8_KOCRH|nr:hypothetical protein [Kocuria rhizophila]TFH99866.1 hypothetical protein E4P33_10030 [Kocuria rhizophila]TFI11688.1 hypothetical protein E4P34_00950 [Kocuria rhizophila]